MRLREQFLEILLEEEIERLLSEAVERKERVHADEHAERLSQRFPAIGLSRDSIADEITAAAVYAGVPVEYSPHWWSGENRVLSWDQRSRMLRQSCTGKPLFGLPLLRLRPARNHDDVAPGTKPDRFSFRRRRSIGIEEILPKEPDAAAIPVGHSFEAFKSG